MRVRRPTPRARRRTSGRTVGEAAISGYRDGAGYVFVVDRKKDLIITGGANIYPAEIEAVLYEHAGVAMAAVIGIPDAVKGEIPKAFIVAKARPEVTAEGLMAWCRQRLAAYKCPRSIEFVDIEGNPRFAALVIGSTLTE